MKTTDTIALRVCLPFSWWRTRDAETQMTLIKPEKNGVPAYAAALCREIESLGRDLQEYRVDTLWFDGGYMGLFMPEQLEAIFGGGASLVPSDGGCADQRNGFSGIAGSGDDFLLSESPNRAADV